MRGRRHVVGAVLMAATLCTALAASQLSSAAPRPRVPSPGTAAQVLAAVRAASSITSLPSPSYPASPLPTSEGADSASHAFPSTKNGCFRVTQCVFGDVRSHKTIVLYGDSHAQMWLSAVAPDARALGYRVVLLYLGGCPFADVTVYNPVPIPPFPAGYYGECNAFRRIALRDIDRLRPRLVLLADRTSMVDSGPGRFFTRAQWWHGVRTTIFDIRRHVGAVAVIGDQVYMSETLPQCLDAYPSHVQTCASPNPNLAAHSHESVERAAARSVGARFINTLAWTCTQTCSPVIGPFLVYLNDAHLDATYVTYLSRVMLTALRGALKGSPVGRTAGGGASVASVARP